MGLFAGVITSIKNVSVHFSCYYKLDTKLGIGIIILDEQLVMRV